VIYLARNCLTAKRIGKLSEATLLPST
jgi:hypothetical protein